MSNPTAADVTLAPAGPRGRLSPKAVVAIAYVGGMFVSVMDIAIVNVALPAISRQFHADTASIDWIVNGYILSLALFMPASGWLGDRLGIKRTFLFALASFTLASALCATASSLGELVAFRVLQGVGGGLLGPVGQTMLLRTFEPSERARMSRLLMVPTLAAPATGPIIGGLLVDSLSWRWIFLINLPIGAAAFLFGLLRLPDHRGDHAGRFDGGGFLLCGGGLVLVLFALSQGPTAGWGSAATVVPALLGVLGLSIFVWYELRQTQPLLYLRILATNRLYREISIASAFGSAAFLGMLFVVPLFLQESRGLSPFQSGLTSFPEAIGVMSASQISGRLYLRLGPKRLISGGLFGMAAMLVLLATIGLGADLWFFRVNMFLIGASMAFLFIPSQTASFATIAPHEMGRTAAFSNVQGRVANAIGVAIFATVLAAGTRVGALAPSLSSFKATLLVAAGMGVLGALWALRVDDRDAAVTMRGGPLAPPGDEAGAGLVLEG